MKATAHHIESLDIFRGVTIAAMILVNNPGDWSNVLPPLEHAYWSGWTFADLVFPWFIFIMGVAMPFAFARRRGRGDASRHLHRRIARRVVWLIVLGLVLNAVSAWLTGSPIRFPGVLQRIALAYLIAALLVLHLNVTGWIVAIAILLLGHWALLVLVPFGGHPAGTLTPEHNLARYLDTLVFGRHTVTTTYDAEGLLGTLTAAATALVGAVVGQFLRSTTDDSARLRGLIAGGIATVVLGWVWSRTLFLSKPLWTGSYVLFVTGLAMLVLASAYAVVDVWRVRSWARPFLWLGVNPLAIYFASDVVGHLLDGVWIHLRGGATTPKSWLFWSLLAPAFPRYPEWASLLFAIAYVSVWVAVAGALYRRGIRIQV